MRRIFSVLLLAFLSSFSAAEVAVIVHPSNTVELSADVIARVFLGKDRTFPGGGQVVPINLAEDTPETKHFNGNVLKKSDGQVKPYWSRLVFTGKGQPPKEVKSTQEMIELISANPNMIGYVDSSAVADSVKVVNTF